jgi:transposase
MVRARRLALVATGFDTDEPADHALGRSRGGFGTKLHVICDGTGVPLSALLLPGQAHESTQFEDLVDSVTITRRTTGRTRKLPKRLAADRAYHAHRIRQWLHQHGIKAVIPPRKTKGKPRRGRPSPMMPSSTAPGMWSSAASAGSRSAVPWQPVLRNWRSTTCRWSSSPLSSAICACWRRRELSDGA